MVACSDDASPGASAGAAGASGAAGGGGSAGISEAGPSTDADVCPTGGGPVLPDGGAEGDHCISEDGGKIIQVSVKPAAGHPEAAPIPAEDGGAEEVSPVLAGNEGNDDDCKYHVKFDVDCTAVNHDATFAVHLNDPTTGAPVGGARPLPRSFCPNSSRRPIRTRKTIPERTGIVRDKPHSV